MHRTLVPQRWRAALLLIPMLVVVALFSLAPTGWVLVNSVRVEDAWSLANFIAITGSSFYRQAFGNSLWIATGSSVCGLLVAMVGAASIRRVDGSVRDVTVALTNMSSNLSGVPLAFAFIIILGANGAATLLLREWGWLGDFSLYSRAGLTLIYTYFQIPLAVLLLYPAFDALDDDWQDSAALLGASALRYWQLVGLPVLLPAMLGTFILLFANAMGAYASAYALMTSNYNLVTIRIASLVAGDIFLEPQLAAALAVLLIALMILMVTINQWLLARTHHGR
ncbi:ABC transporter permease [Actimicrobium antarcticum]|uniref:ABC transporter permease subunit n=1 Tax=Actimicrobium antarcticum TaxID=1051899 RepID=A0ABP7U229_9BURK